QGLSAFPGNHPLHVGMGFGDYAVPAAANAFAGCDCLLAVGTRFSEIPTGSYSMPVSACLIHVDINPEVFNANFPARITLEGDAAQIMPALLREVDALQPAPRSGMAERIRADKAAYRREWLKHDSKDRENPAHFFGDLRSQLDADANQGADDGSHNCRLPDWNPSS